MKRSIAIQRILSLDQLLQLAEVPMPHICPRSMSGLFAFVVSVLLMSGGCRMAHESGHVRRLPSVTAAERAMPRELCKTILPTYTIEPPDILTIDAVHIVPKQPYHLKTLDALNIEVRGALSDQPITGIYPIEPGGLVNLGFGYGSVDVGGLDIDSAKERIEEHLGTYLSDPTASVTLSEMSAKQQIAGEHMVGPDGTVTLGTYGSVQVVGLSIAQAKWAVEAHLSEFLDAPEVSVDVFAYNSKVYYIVTQGAGLGDGVFRFPVTGNETVLDAISQINGLEQVSSKRIWIARPTREPGNVQVLPVSWDAITAQASTNTNYQIFPGDRVFIAEDKLIAFDTTLGKIIAPFERIMGITMLGATTATRLSGPVLRGGGEPRGSYR